MDTEKEILQQADCYVEGLTPLPFHDINSVTYPWAVELARSYQAINNELQVYNQNQINIMNADQEWLPPRDAVGDAYIALLCIHHYYTSHNTVAVSSFAVALPLNCAFI